MSIRIAHIENRHQGRHLTVWHMAYQRRCDYDAVILPGATAQMAPSSGTGAPIAVARNQDELASRGIFVRLGTTLVSLWQQEGPDGTWVRFGGDRHVEPSERNRLPGLPEIRGDMTIKVTIDEEGRVSGVTMPLASRAPAEASGAEVDAQPAGAAPLLEALKRRLGSAHGRWEGLTYNLRRVAMPGDGFLVQTPSYWGRPAADLPDGHSQGFADLLRTTIASADHVVDIVTMAPAPTEGDELFRAIQDGLKALWDKHAGIVVRILFGFFPTSKLDTETLARTLTALCRGPSSGPLRVYVAASRTSLGATVYSNSWNHAKILAVDGRVAIVGGHNLWAADYLHKAPIHDVSLRLEGAPALDAHTFANLLWRDVANKNRHQQPRPRDLAPHRNSTDLVATGESPQVGTRAMPHVWISDSHSRGPVSVLSLGRLAQGISARRDEANSSEIARVEAIRQAKKTIRLSQQDLGMIFGNPLLWHNDFMNALAGALLDGRDLYIVLSSPGAMSGGGQWYSWLVPLAKVAERIRKEVINLGGRRGPEIDRMLCLRLHLAPIRFSADDVWPGNPRPFPIGNHAKMWIIDDQAFYVGSDNAYLAGLQEFGYACESPDLTRRVLEEYWNPLWEHSRRAAISGVGASMCYFADNPSDAERPEEGEDEPIFLPRPPE